jgi:hypothetical protein
MRPHGRGSAHTLPKDRRIERNRSLPWAGTDGAARRGRRLSWAGPGGRRIRGRGHEFDAHKRQPAPANLGAVALVAILDPEVEFIGHVRAAGQCKVRARTGEIPHGAVEGRGTIVELDPGAEQRAPAGSKTKI